MRLTDAGKRYVRLGSGAISTAVALGTFAYPCFTCRPYILGVSIYWLFIFLLFAAAATASFLMKSPRSGIESTMSISFAAVNVLYFGYNLAAGHTGDDLILFMIINLLLAGLVIVIGRKVGRLINSLIQDPASSEELPL